MTRMNFSCGDHVMYANYGVCEIVAVEQRPDFHDPDKIINYYSLKPLNERLGKVLLPESRLDALRPTVSKQEALDLIDNVKIISIDAFTDKSHKAIEDHFRTLLRSNNIEDVICVVKSMHSRIMEQTECGKHPSTSYLRLEKEARKRFHSELAYALAIEEDDVEDFIKSRIDN